MTKENEKKLLYLIGIHSMANTEFLNEYNLTPTKCEEAYKGYEDVEDPPDEVCEKYEKMYGEEFAEKLSKLLETDQDNKFFLKLFYGMDK